MKRFYTAAQAVKKLRIPRSTFYYLIKIGVLPAGTVPPLKKQALYPADVIDAIALARLPYFSENGEVQ